VAVFQNKPFTLYQPGSPTSSPAFNAPALRRVYDPALVTARIVAAERQPFPVYPSNRAGTMLRPAQSEPQLEGKFQRGQNLSALAGTGSVLGLVGVFAGQPDQIDLLASGGDAIVELQDRLGLNGIRYRIPINVLFRTQVSRERVMAFNVSDAAPATVTAVGKWALLNPPVNGSLFRPEGDSGVSELGLTSDEDRPGSGY